MKETNKKVAGFTLIELLIVVAIIAILAAIAVPNFMEAQVRSKVSRSQADMRSQAVALEAYFVDWNKYTRDSDSSLDTIIKPGFFQVDATATYGDLANGITQLTTPVAYITSILKDPFAPAPKTVGAGGGALGYRIASGSWSYGCPDTSAAAQTATDYEDLQNCKKAFNAVGGRACFALIGVGPDQARARVGYKCFPFMGVDPKEVLTAEDSFEVLANSNNNKDTQPSMYTSYDSTNGSTSKGDIYRFGGSYTEGRFAMDGKIVGAAGKVPETATNEGAIWNPATLTTPAP